MDKQKLLELMDQIDALEDVQLMLDRIQSYREYLLEFPHEELNDRQKLWLLACEASETKISTSSKESIAENIVLLKDAIIDIEK
jgi:hypothetical protein